jgi:arginine/lysine/ornithine decarboxylase
LKAKLTGAGFTFASDERLKLTLSTKPYGHTGEQVAKHLQDRGIYVEFCDNDYVTMMFSPCNRKKDFKRLEKALLSIKQSTPLTSLPPCAHILKVGMPMNEAITAPWEEIKVDDAVGRILASPTVSCPPAIPVVVCGEIIDEKAVEIMKYYAIDTCIVVKKQKHKFLNFLKSKI